MLRPGISDHDSVAADIQLKAKVSKKPRRIVFVYDKANPEILQQEISELQNTFKATYSGRDANENWQFFKTGVIGIIKKVVQTKVIQGRHYLPWLDRALKRKIGKRNRLHRRAKRASPRHRQKRWDAYHKLLGSVKADIQQAYKQYMNSLFEDENTGRPSKKIWKTIKAGRNDQVSIPPLKGKNGRLETTGKGKAEVLNKQYSSVFTEEDTSSIQHMDDSPYLNMPHIKVTTRGVKSLLQKLNP